MDETKGFQCLGHSNLTICSTLHLSHSKIIPSVSPSYWEANSYYPRGILWEKGILPTSKMNEREGFQYLGHSNLTICSPLSHFCSDIFATFTLSYSGDHFLLPQGANNGKREFFPPKKWIRQRVFSAWGNQTGPFASL